LLEPQKTWMADQVVDLSKIVRRALREAVGQMTGVVVPEVYLVGVGVVKFHIDNSLLAVVSRPDKVGLAKVRRNARPEVQLALRVFLGSRSNRLGLGQVLVETGHWVKRAAKGLLLKGSLERIPRCQVPTLIQR